MSMELLSELWSGLDEVETAKLVEIPLQADSGSRIDYAYYVPNIDIGARTYFLAPDENALEMVNRLGLTNLVNDSYQMIGEAKERLSEVLEKDLGTVSATVYVISENGELIHGVQVLYFDPEGGETTINIEYHYDESGNRRKLNYNKEKGTSFRCGTEAAVFAKERDLRYSNKGSYMRMDIPYGIKNIRKDVVQLPLIR